ncbi:MAG: aspartate aminotransferase family protein [Bacteroidales bacterium]|nr:aspartate aminotransferase family protein [Bacteroidales bacterium]
MQERPYILRDLFFNRVAQTSSAPLGVNIKRAEGVFLYSVNDDGTEKPIMDLISGVSVSNVGHCNREVVDAIKAQAEKYTHIMVYGEMIESPQVLHAELLTSVLPKELNNIYYVNSGSEANEGALKLAKRVTGRGEMISFKHAYHGSSHGALSMMSDAAFKSAFQPLLPNVKYLDFNSIEGLREITEKTACVLIEPVQGEGGVQVATKEFMAALRNRCSEVGALLIFDEIQTGFGRTGKMFAFEHYNVVPDILTMAKALGGGMPLGAFAAPKELMNAWQSNPPLGHITTFGGHPVSCAAALASLKILLRERWIDEVKEKNRMYVEALSAHPRVKEIRSLGLLIAVDLKDESAAHDILYRLLEEGVLTDWFLFQPTSFRIAPPLCISFDEVKLSIDLIIKALDKL